MVKNSVKQINKTLSNYLVGYKKQHSPTIEAEYDCVGKLVHLLNDVDSSYFIRISVDLRNRKTEMSNELFRRLLRAGAINEGSTESTLVYRASKPYEDSIGNTSGSRNAALSGVERTVFEIERCPDFPVGKFEEGRPHALVKVNPTGIYMASMRYESHGILLSMIKCIEVTIEPTKLTPVYDNRENTPVKTELFWK